MTKTELIEELSYQAGLTKSKARNVVDALTDIITDRLTSNCPEKVTIRGFGTFDVSHHDSRTGVDPQDPDKTIEIPARAVPKFRAGTRLKEAVRQTYDQD